MSTVRNNEHRATRPTPHRRSRRVVGAGICAALVFTANLSTPVAQAVDGQVERLNPRQARARQNDIRTEQARLAAELEPLQATQAEMEAALAALSEQVRAQQARADDARRSADEARHRAEDLVRQQLATGHAVDQLLGLLRDRAIAAYVNPTNRMDDTERLLASEDLSELDRNNALLDSVTGSTTDLSDQLRRHKLRLGQLEDQHRAALAEAEGWQAAEEEALRELQLAEEHFERIKAVYDEKVRGIDSHLAALSTEDAELEQLINDAETRQRAIEDANRRANAALSGGPPPNAPGQISGAPGPGGCLWPLPGARVSRGFAGAHKGIDMFAPHGAPIYASMAGEVIFSGWNSGGYGNLILIDHGGDIVTAYAHLSGFAVGVGAQVGRGQLIGYEGSTGRSTGPHLHFEVRIGGRAVDPDGCLGTNT